MHLDKCFVWAPCVVSVWVYLDKVRSELVHDQDGDVFVEIFVFEVHPVLGGPQENAYLSGKHTPTPASTRMASSRGEGGRTKTISSAARCIRLKNSRSSTP